MNPNPIPNTTALVPTARRAGGDRLKADAANPAVQVLHYLRQHLLLILFCGTLLGGGLAYTAWNVLPMKYESYAILLVASSPNSIAAGNDPRGKADFATYINTAKSLIKSDFVLSTALSDAKYRISECPTLKAQKNPIKYLEEKLVVTASEQSEVVRISLEGDQPDDVRKIVDAVKDAYYREVVEKEIDQKTNLKHKVEVAKTAIHDLMKIKAVPLPSNRTAPGVLASRTPPSAPQPVGPTPLIPGGVTPAGGILIPEIPGVPTVVPAGGILPIPSGATAAAVIALTESEPMKRARADMLFKRISQSEIDLQQFPIVLSEKAADAARVRKELDKHTAPVPTAEALAAAERDPDVAMKLADAAKKKRDYEFQVGVVRDPNSEAMQRKKREVAEADAAAEALKQERAGLLEAARSRSESARLATLYDNLIRDLDRIKERERLMRKVYEDDKKELAEMPPELRKSEEKGPIVDAERTDLLTHDDYYRRLTGQVIGLDLELQSPPRVRKLQDASAPSAKETQKQLLGTIAAGLLGFCLVGVGAVAYETRAKKVCSLTEIKTQGSVPILGVIPWLVDRTAMNDPLKRADILESLDKLRSVVAQTWLNRGVGIIAVTSPLSDEGKAFTAYGLASSLSQAGYRTLLVDFDLRNPSLHTYAGVPNVAGVCELLRSEDDSRTSQILLPNGLTFLPAGLWSDDVRRSAVGGKLERLLAGLRENFQFVVLHGHGLLSVAESIEIVRRSDAVLLCTLYRETRMPMLKRALERLASLEAQNTGLVYLGASRTEALC